ncbi:MAG: O-antigen ligase family protein [Planctomycetota bacterium]
MTRTPTNPSTSKSKTLVYLEYALLALCLSVIALRATLTEGPPMQSTARAVNLSDNLYSISVSAVLIFSFVLWIVWSFYSKGFLYRPAGMEIGLGIFCIGAAVAGFAAADKRLAITDIAVSVAPLLTALLLVQILDSREKIKIVLVVIAALGAVSAYQCAEQFFVSNQMTIEQYQQDPQTFLEPLGIEPGSFQQFLFEHRLYSRGVRGFFTTRNSAGSFALMAFFAAVALFLDKFRNRKSEPSGTIYLMATGGIAVIVLLSLVLTRSKGAIIGLFFAAAVLMALLRFGNWVKTHREALLVSGLLLCIGCGGAIVWYGLSHDRLPGGGSMLVRWQYWHASAKMYADHPLTGVGPGNFGHFYTRYKPASALESVADPHNFPLSILTQYGPLGLVGFLVMIFIPLWRATSPGAIGPAAKTGVDQPVFRTLATALLIVVSAALLFARPILSPSAPAETLDVAIYLIVTLYVASTAVFVVAFILLAGPLRKTRSTRDERQETTISVVLICAVLSVAVHNLTDFAIFEPGVFTTFWAMIACLAALSSNTNSLPRLVRRPALSVKIIIAAAVAAAAWVFIGYALVPVAESTAKIRQANEAISAGRFEDAHRLLEQAAENDPLSSAALSLDGRLYLHRFESAQNKNPDLLLRSEKCLKIAIERNNTAYQNFERLTEVYDLLAENSTRTERTDWLNKAFDTASTAVERYPGAGRLHLKLGKIADQLGKTEIAVKEYRNSIEIENQYRDQFRLMYPEREEVVSRIGEENYQFATLRIMELIEDSDN